MDITTDDIAAEWRRRAGRDGLARVMRASQPPALAADVTQASRDLTAGFLDRVATRLGRPVASALEVGCGIGRITPTIAEHARRVVALDLTSEMLSAAQNACAAHGNVEFHQYPAQRLPWGTSRFDVAVSIWVLMHILDETELAVVCKGLAASARHLVLIEYETAAIPVGRFSRLRPLSHYLDAIPGASLVERRELLYGGDRSFAALIALDT